MRAINRILIIVTASLWFAGCSSNDDFVINGTIKGVDTQTLSIIYFARNGMQSQVVHVTGGKFNVTGVAEKPTLAVITLSDGTRLATLIVRNGEEITLEADPQNPYSVKVDGSSGSAEIARWLNENATALSGRHAPEVNAAVAKYVESHRDRLSATAILVNYFQSKGYEASADSLFSLLDSRARPSEVVNGFNAVINTQLAADATAPVTHISLYELRDSMVTFTPSHSSATLLCFTSDDRASIDSIRGHLRNLRNNHTAERLQMYEISTASDSATWRKSFRSDTLSNWRRTWVPGSLGAPAIRRLAIPRLPYFIVTDSTGAQIYRGASLRKADEALLPIISH